MKFNEHYKGINVTVTTARANANWTSKAEVFLPGHEPLTLEDNGVNYPSEDEARAAALSLAAEVIDRSRTHIGKR